MVTLVANFLEKKSKTLSPSRKYLYNRRTNPYLIAAKPYILSISASEMKKCGKIRP